MVWVVWLLSLRWAKSRHGQFDLKIFKWANHFRIESDGRYEFESNLEASQVPINMVVIFVWWVLQSTLIYSMYAVQCLLAWRLLLWQPQSYNCHHTVIIHRHSASNYICVLQLVCCVQGQSLWMTLTWVIVKTWTEMLIAETKVQSSTITLSSGTVVCITVKISICSLCLLSTGKN